METVAAEECETEVEKLGRLNQIYLAIISRYKEYIQEKESLSVAELPVLVTPKNEAVAKKVTEIKGCFDPYSYEKDFYPACTNAFGFVKDDIAKIVLPLEFWLSPEETLTFMMGDMMDKNILLCSLFVALGNPSAKVLVRIRDETFKAFVYFEFDEKFYAFDIDDGTKEFQNKEAMIATLNIDDETTVYEFNNQTYLDIS
jgi:hypothetical protein